MYIVNASINHNTFLFEWKKYLVTPIPENVNPNNNGELRPIILFRVASKILEHIVLNQIQLLPIFQSDFKKCHSTSIAFTAVVDDTYIAKLEFRQLRHTDATRLKGESQILQILTMGFPGGQFWAHCYFVYTLAIQANMFLT